MFDLYFYDLVRKYMERKKDNQDLVDYTLRMRGRVQKKRMNDVLFEVETQKMVKKMYTQTYFVDYMDEFCDYFKIGSPQYGFAKKI